MTDAARATDDRPDAQPLPWAPTPSPATQLHVASFAELNALTLYALLRLRADVFVVEQACPYPDLDGRDLEPDTRHVWLTAAGGAGRAPAPLAYLRILDASTSHPEVAAASAGRVRIGRVCVAADARRAGHAAALLTAAVDLIGDREAVLHAQSYAVALYERAGFVVDGPEFTEDDIPHLPMRRAPGALRGREASQIFA